MRNTTPVPQADLKPHESRTLEPYPKNPDPDVSNETLLADLFKANGDVDDLIHHHKLSPARFLAFAEDPTVIRTLAAWEAYQERYQRILIRQHQAGAAGLLHQSVVDSSSLAETRRAATSLSRLTSSMIAAQRFRRPPGRLAPDAAMLPPPPNAVHPASLPASLPVSPLDAPPRPVGELSATPPVITTPIARLAAAATATPPSPAATPRVPKARPNA